MKKLKVVYSEEEPIKPVGDMEDSCPVEAVSPPDTESHGTKRRSIPGSTAFVPSVAGLIMAGEVVKDLTRSYSGI